tara:strand:- start:1028 stop:2011 length:984 start_codon:yes stop_codon:yes gene_type:complete
MNKRKKSMFVDKIKLKNNVLLAPMSGVSDAPFREIVKKFEPGLVFSEMIASRALIEQNKKTLHMAKKNNDEILAIQIAGCDPEVMFDAAKICEDIGADIVDINMGCPVKKVVNGYAGSALMKDEKLAVKILRSVFKAVKIPVTLKMRTGWDDSSRNAPQLARIAEDIGISMITIHGRTRCQMYKGKSDWAFIKNVKDSVKIPVIANGDVENFNDVNNILKISNADGLMIGRGSYGKPWIFKDITSKFENKKKIEMSLEFKKSIILEHFNLSLEHYGISVGVKNFRKHLGWYSKSFKNSNVFREKINNSLDYKKIEQLTNEFFCYENI